MISKDTKVIIQGITGKQGRFHTERMQEYGTNIVGGVTPGKGGQDVLGVPVFESCAEAVKHVDAEWSIIFVPSKYAKNAALEALEAELHIVLITENVPVYDSLEVVHTTKAKGRIMIGPNSPGIIAPGKTKLGIMPGHIFREGQIGLVSRSGTLTYEIIDQLSKAGHGQSIVFGIGGDPVIGTNFVEALELLEEDKNTKCAVLVGEIGGDAEERAAAYILDGMSKPVVAYITGRTAPKGKQMGHAGAVISGNTGTADSKIKALEAVGVQVATLPSDIVRLISHLQIPAD